jgi:hypothetical protein
VHPILANVRNIALYLFAAVAVGALVAAGLEGGSERMEITLALFLPASVGYGLVCLSTWYLCRAFPLTAGPSAWRAVPVHALASVLASALWGLLTDVWARVLDQVTATDAASSVLATRRPALFLVGVLVYWLAAAVHYLFITVEVSREAERNAFEQNLLAKEAELKALRAQIDPHFMFNSLHSIGALTATDPAAARRMCLLLADFLRETLRLGASRRIPLADELALVDRFVAIEQIRFGPRLQFDRQSDPAADACLVPPLILQPLVENAVVHGVSQMVEGGLIHMRATCSPRLLTITIENPCDPDRPHGRGVGLGLELLRRRLTTQFGIADAVQAAEDDGRFRVEIRLPVEITT